MESNRIQVFFFSTLVVIALIFAFLIFQPYLMPLFLSAIFAIAAYPFYKWVLRQVGGRKSAAASLSVLAIFLAIVIPATLFGFVLFNEVRNLYDSVSVGRDTGVVHTFSAAIENKVSDVFPNAALDIKAYVSQSLDWFAQHLGTFFSSFVGILLGLVILLFGLFFLFRDGKNFADEAIRVSPLPDKEDKEIFKRVAQVINTVLASTVAIAVAKAILSGIGFAIFGVPNPVFWGTVSGVASLVPVIGSMLVILPIVIYSLIYLSLWQAVALFVWGIVVVGLIDNVLMPILLRRGAKVHPFLGFLSVIGGVTFFGPVGIIAGPVVLGVVLALFEAYPRIISKKTS
ncbi:MAG: AI-2E family transporter [Candidatus Paceibacterota bacterium]|jgi:predicted PurR-regulated permease PerM